MTRPYRLAAPLLALSALLTSGCQHAVFAFANRGLAPPDATVTFAPEVNLALDVYRPEAGPKRDAGAAPVVVFFYGGGWTEGTRDQYRFVGRQLARQGLLAIVADYRTYPRAAFPAFVEDGARAVGWALQHAADYGGDRGRVFAAGHSAGAQIAALLATDPRYLAAQGHAPRELAGVIGLSGPYDFSVSAPYRPIFGPPSQWPRAQAVNFVDGDEPPFLLVHGTADHTVGVCQASTLQARLRSQGVQATLLLLPDAGHTATVRALYAPGSQPRVLEAITRFARNNVAIDRQ